MELEKKQTTSVSTTALVEARMAPISYRPCTCVTERTVNETPLCALRRLWLNPNPAWSGLGEKPSSSFFRGPKWVGVQKAFLVGQPFLCAPSRQSRDIKCALFGVLRARQLPTSLPLSMETLIRTDFEPRTVSRFPLCPLNASWNALRERSLLVVSAFLTGSSC